MTVVKETMTFPGSSNLSEAEYDPEVENLTITFASGDAYVYYNVPPAVYRALCAAPSAGSYFHRAIRQRYSYESA